MMKRFTFCLACVFAFGMALVSTDVQAQSNTKKKATPVLKIGDKAPDFELAGIGDKKIKLSERFGDKGKPVILLFSRANW